MVEALGPIGSAGHPHVSGAEVCLAGFAAKAVWLIMRLVGFREIREANRLLVSSRDLDGAASLSGGGLLSNRRCFRPARFAPECLAPNELRSVEALLKGIFPATEPKLFIPLATVEPLFWGYASLPDERPFGAALEVPCKVRPRRAVGFARSQVGITRPAEPASRNSRAS